ICYLQIDSPERPDLQIDFGRGYFAVNTIADLLQESAEDFAGSGCVPTGEERWSDGGAVVAGNGGAGFP
ncbi:hypothetical protein U1Q18_035636, partial [Sarracenia purpurea var. burkii]